MDEYDILREEIFVITKIYPSQFNDPETAIDMALEKIDIGYIDMMLLHHPGNGDVEAYKTMERYVEEGKIQEQEVVPFIQDKGIVVQCWYPLGGRGYTSELRL